MCNELAAASEIEAENNSWDERKICEEDVEDFGRLFAGRKRDAINAGRATTARTYSIIVVAIALYRSASICSNNCFSSDSRHSHKVMAPPAIILNRGVPPENHLFGVRAHLSACSRGSSLCRERSIAMALVAQKKFNPGREFVLPSSWIILCSAGW